MGKALALAVEWRFAATLMDLIVAGVVTQDLGLAAGIAGGSMVLKTLVHGVWMKYRT